MARFDTGYVHHNAEKAHWTEGLRGCFEHRDPELGEIHGVGDIVAYDG